MDEFPKMLFRSGGEENCHGLMCETRVVNDEAEAAEAAAEGFADTPEAAHGAAPASKKTNAKQADSDVAVLEAHIVKLEGLIEEANARSAAAEKRATDAEEGHARVTDALEAKNDEIERLTKQIEDLTAPKPDEKPKKDTK